MGRPRNPIPVYRRLRRPGKEIVGIVDVRTADGRKTSRVLPGSYGSAESVAEYHRLLELLAANNGRLPPLAPPPPAPEASTRPTGDETLSEVILRFWVEKVEVDYCDAEGKPSSEQSCYRLDLRPLNRLYGPSLAAEFDASALSALRQAMVDGSWLTAEEKEKRTKQGRPIGWVRSRTNKAISRIRTMFRWAVFKKIVPVAVVQELECLEALKPGRGARESDPVVPVPLESIDATLPHLPPVVADMVRVQLATACRPGELCAMRGIDIDRQGPIWLYNPKGHKTAHRGHKRSIAIGPQAQLILRRYLKDDPDAFLFSPVEQAELIRVALRAKRKTPLPRSRPETAVKAPSKRAPKNRFSAKSYNRAIARGCLRAKVAHWHVHQLRHTAARLIAREHGDEAARAVLGHRTISMTAHYAGVDVEAAREVAQAMG